MKHLTIENPLLWLDAYIHVHKLLIHAYTSNIISNIHYTVLTMSMPKTLTALDTFASSF